MPIYVYQHPDTKEIFEILRSFKDCDKPFFAPDGTKCEKRISIFTGYKKDREVFEVDPAYVKQMNPKRIKFRDGHVEKYDSTKHC